MNCIRRFVLFALVAVASICGAHAQDKQMTVRIGWNALAGAAPISVVMQEEKLFEKHAKNFGYEITTEWTRFTAGPPANEAFVAGRLDLDMDVASAAYVARIKQEVPVILIGTQASHLSNAIMVRPGGNVKEVADLEGKTIGLFANTSAHYTLASIVKEHLGKSLREANIKIVNMSPSESVKMPQGLDAAVIWVPFQFMGPHLGLSELLIDANGLTGKGHSGPLRQVDEVKKAWGYPEGYFTDRLYISARKQFVESDPNLAVAFLLARWEAQDIIAGNFTRAVALANELWKLPAQVTELAVATYPENTNIRNAPILLEYDALALIKTSEFFHDLGTISTPLTWAELGAVMRPGADIQKKAWELRGSQPSVEQLVAGFKGSAPGWPSIIINGGEPVWRIEQVKDWGSRRYVAEPFGRK